MSRPDPSAVMREEELTLAADWVLRLREPAVTAAEIAEWLEWCESDPDNKSAFDRMQTLLHRSTQIEEQPINETHLASDTYFGQMSVREWNDQRDPTNTTSVSTMRERTSRRFTPWLIAAMIAMVALGVGWRSDSLRSTSSGDVVIATTGENRIVELPDGTQVTIAAGSRVTTDYSASERAVFLGQGEAYFQVKKDPQRPFVVHALGTKVTAVGTAFNVRAEQQIVRVAITEGVVDFEPAGPSSLESIQRTAMPKEAERIRLSAGHQITFAATEPKPIVVSTGAQRAISWVSGTLQFVDEPLSSVIAAVNRYYDKTIVIEDSELSSRRFTGTVVADRVHEWLNGLPDVFPIVVDDRDDSVIIRVDAR